MQAKNQKCWQSFLFQVSDFFCAKFQLAATDIFDLRPFKVA